MDRAPRATPKVHENEALILKRHGGAIQERGARRTAFPTIARGFECASKKWQCSKWNRHPGFPIPSMWTG